jgi:hypothetical protein
LTRVDEQRDVTVVRVNLAAVDVGELAEQRGGSLNAEARLRG